MNRAYTVLNNIFTLVAEDETDFQESKSRDFHSIKRMLVGMIAIFWMASILGYYLPGQLKSLADAPIAMVMAAIAAILASDALLIVISWIIGFVIRKKRREEKERVELIENGLLDHTMTYINTMPEDLREEYGIRIAYALRYDHLTDEQVRKQVPNWKQVIVITLLGLALIFGSIIVFGLVMHS